jgi:hypothetical protein
MSSTINHKDRSYLVSLSPVTVMFKSGTTVQTIIFPTDTAAITATATATATALLNKRNVCRETQDKVESKTTRKTSKKENYEKNQ